MSARREPPPGGGGFDYPPPPPPADRVVPPPPLPPGPPPPMYNFQGDHYSPSRRDDRRNDFAFAPADIRAPQYPGDHYRPGTSRSDGTRYSQNGRMPQNSNASQTARDRWRNSRGQQGRGSAYRKMAPHERPLMRTQRGSTPEQLPGMTDDQNGETGARRFMLAEDLSDSDDQEMEMDSGSDMDNDHSSGANLEDGEVAEEPPRKKQMQEKTPQEQAIGASAPKWSNPDPYTVLPPPDESQRKKKDVVKLIRKARIELTQDEVPKNAVAKNDDFISFDFGRLEDETGSGQEQNGSGGSQNGIPKAPKGPKAFSHRDVFHDTASNGAPGTNGTSLSTASMGPPPGVSQNKPAAAVPVDVWPPPSVDAALGNRKRTYDDQIKESSVSHRGKGEGPERNRLLNSIVSKWRSHHIGESTPWLNMDHSETTDMGFWLHKEICDYYDFVRPKDYEQQVRDDLLQRLRNSLRHGYQGCELHCFGSFAAGLYLPDADMDMVLISKRYRETKSPTFVRGKDFHSFAAMLTRSNIAQKMIVISKAKVPIIKFVDALTGLRVDISFDNGSGLVANETFQAWKLQYPAMPVIVVLIKQLLAMRDLNDVSTKGLGGFSVTCLVVSMLQLMPQVQSGAMVPEQRLGDLLMEFLDLYGNKFDTRKSVISLDPPGYLEKQLNQTNLPYRAANSHRLAIIDPNRPDNDISGGTGKIATIQDLFAQAFNALRDRMDILRTADTSQRKGQSILGTLLGGNYATFDHQRDRLRRLHEQSGCRLQGPAVTEGNSQVSESLVQARGGDALEVRYHDAFGQFPLSSDGRDGGIHQLRVPHHPYVALKGSASLVRQKARNAKAAKAARSDAQTQGRGGKTKKKKKTKKGPGHAKSPENVKSEGGDGTEAHRLTLINQTSSKGAGGKGVMEPESTKQSSAPGTKGKGKKGKGCQPANRATENSAPGKTAQKTKQSIQNAVKGNDEKKVVLFNPVNQGQEKKPPKEHRPGDSEQSGHRLLRESDGHNRTNRPSSPDLARSSTVAAFSLRTRGWCWAGAGGVSRGDHASPPADHAAIRRSLGTENDPITLD